MKGNVEQVLDKKIGAGRDQLIPILQAIQEKEGYLSKTSVVKVGRHLNMPASKIFGVATFYNQFRFEPLGKYHVQVCRGTACHVLGSATVLEKLQDALRIKPDQTSRDAMFSLEVVACIGACGLAPVICINGEFHAKVTVDSLKKIIKELIPLNVN
jgi:NADH-quinone oxidoreductase subunit E